ncbi:MAG: glycosyltransferase family 4 protein [Deltaproteobacteria bacterium]|jgi:glycosyltransferase involved in cell wall biosynthesis|nr:glycosyltransferase family 4 protein [Deltaproteobacteria bacterium]
MKIGFFTDGVPFEGDSLEKQPLGGSESAFISVTRALNRLGHEITAFNNCARSAVHQGVQYHPFRSTLNRLAWEKFDVFVVSRFFGVFNIPFRAAVKVLWNHDTLDNTQVLKSVHDEIDLFLVLSAFHRDNFLTRLPQLSDRMVVTRNGLDFNLLDEASKGARKDPHKLLYASRPERGLKILLEKIWPRLKQAKPELRLHLCGYQMSADYLSPELKELYSYLNLLVKSDPDIIDLGPLGKKDYYRHLAESALLVYPCCFPEISCLVVLEAQALGTPLVTTNDYALTESVKLEEFKVPGRPRTPSYWQSFVERTLYLLNNPQRTEKLALKARNVIRSSYAWDQIAGEWERLFKLSLRAQSSARDIIQTGGQRSDTLLV